MKRILALSGGALAFLVQTASAQTTTLLTTTNDFLSSSSSEFIALPNSDADLDGSGINGLGNTTAPGAAGTPGSVGLTWQSGTFDSVMLTPGEQGNAAFLNALETAGTLSFDYTTPEAGEGTYFQLGLVLNYQGEFDQLFGTTTDLGEGVTQTTIDFTAESAKLISQQALDEGSFSYFQLGVVYNSNFDAPDSPFTVDNFQVMAAPEPATYAMMGAGLAGLMMIRRRRSRS
jgi:hypothetical protein